jgi:hypothetical protein
MSPLALAAAAASFFSSLAATAAVLKILFVREFLHHFMHPFLLLAFCC